LFVAVGADHAPQPVRKFPTFTRDLHALADWLDQCGVRPVAMDSTSVYRIPLLLRSRYAVTHKSGGIRWFYSI
jgi:transposase